MVKRIDPYFRYEWHEIEDDIMKVYVGTAPQPLKKGKQPLGRADN